MRHANDAQIKVYLYLLRMMHAHRPTSISDMADQFNHTEKEVLRSLRFWEGQGLLVLQYNADRDIVGIHLSRLQAPAPQRDNVIRIGMGAALPEAAVPERVERAAVSPSAEPLAQTEVVPTREDDLSRSKPAGEPEASAPAPVSSRTMPASASALEAFRSNQKRAQLLFVIEQYIGKPLSPSEIQTVYYISEELHFSDSLIDYLLQYCIDRGKKDFRYIEKVAVNWAENGITTPRQAELAVSPLHSSGRNLSGTKASANKFNQFPQNRYDFDQLEQQILGG